MVNVHRINAIPYVKYNWHTFESIVDIVANVGNE